MNVLLVEKDEDVCSFVSTGLQEYNCIIDIANDSYIGLKFALEKKYDVIVLDVMLPYFNGFDLCKKIRENNIKTPIIMISDLDLYEDKVTAFNYGADNFIIKPFSFHKLYKSIRKAYKRNLKTNICCN